MKLRNSSDFLATIKHFLQNANGHLETHTASLLWRQWKMHDSRLRGWRGGFQGREAGLCDAVTVGTRRWPLANLTECTPPGGNLPVNYRLRVVAVCPGGLVLGCQCTICWGQWWWGWLCVCADRAEMENLCASLPVHCTPTTALENSP